jgi:hypothetical protein
MLNQLGHAAISQSPDRGATRQSLNNGQAEGLRPSDGKEQAAALPRSSTLARLPLAVVRGLANARTEHSDAPLPYADTVRRFLKA